MDAPDVLLTRRDLLKLRTALVTERERVPLATWRQLAASKAMGTLRSPKLAELQKRGRISDPADPDSDYSAEILETLRLWHEGNPGKATLASFLALLRDNSLGDLADRIKEAFAKKAGATTPPRPPPSAGGDRPDGRIQTDGNGKRARAPRLRLGGDFRHEITDAVPDIMRHAQNLDQVLALLLSEDVLKANELELVQSKPNESDKWATLTFLFTRKSRPTWDKFKAALRDNGNPKLVESIRKHTPML